MSSIEAMMIFEVLGRPPEHLIETLEDIIDKIGKEKGVRVTSKKINEPKTLKDRKDFFTTFAEVTLECEEVLQLIVILFKFAPAHVEIISPEVVTMKNFEWNQVINEITLKIHKYDEVMRILQSEKMILEKKLKGLEEEDD